MTRAHKMSPAEIVLATLRAATPPSAPSPLARVVRARFIGKRQIAADVLMFDGLPASMTLNRWALGWAFGYEDMEGGPAWLDGNVWRRETPYLPLFELAVLKAERDVEGKRQ